jgi:hypothetical protein
LQALSGKTGGEFEAARLHNPASPVNRNPPMRLLFPLSAALLLAACASTTPVADVTRFHLGQPLPRDTISVLLPEGASLEARSHATALEAELARLGFQPIPDDGRSAYLASLRTESSSRQGPPRASSFNIGVGGGSFGRRGGIGVGTNIPVGRERPGATVNTTLLSLDIRRRSDNSVVWEARGSRDTAARDTASPVPGLIRAMLSDFPGPSGQMQQVRIP